MLNTKRSFVAAVTCLYLTSIIPASAHAGVTDDLYSAAKTLAHDAKSAARIAKRELAQKLTSNRIEGSFEDIYPKPFLQTTTGKTALIGGSAVVVATITYFTAGAGLASAGPVSTWVGTQVGMATGVGSGATAAGLAVLGGGTIASGGFGIAGGLAVLAAISDVGIMIALEQVGDAIPNNESAYEKYRLLKIPVPKKANDEVLKRLEKAEVFTAELKELDPFDPMYAKTRSKIRKQYDDALGLLKEIDPKSPEAGYDYITRAVLEYNFMQYEKALGSISEAMQFTKNKAFCGYMLGLIRLTQGDSEALDDAATVLDQVSKDDPTAIPPYLLQTIVHMDKGHPQIALQKAQNGLKHVDDNFELNWRAAEIAFHPVKHYQLAVELYKDALSNITQNEMEAQCKMMVAVSYYRQNRRKKALKWYENAIDEIKDKPDQVTKMSELWNNLK